MTPNTAIRCDDIRLMLRITANAVVQLGPAYLPLLKRLEGELAAAEQKDPASYARRLLQTLAAP